MKTFTKKPAHRKGIKKGRGPTRFPGISADAMLLGTNRTHLYKVVSGRRTSHSLLARYRELKASQKGAGK